jgi:hypothetical protein
MICCGLAVFAGAAAIADDSGMVERPVRDSIKTIIPAARLYDFEGEKTPLQWGWIVVTDTIMNGNSTAEISIVPDGTDGSEQALLISGTVESENPFVMFAGMASRFGHEQPLCYDITDFSGVRFWAKGDGNTYRIDLPTAAVTDFMYYSFPFTPPVAEWKEYKIPFKGFKQQPYGKPVPWTGTDVVGVHFFTVGGPLENFTLQVDQIEFYK